MCGEQPNTDAWPFPGWMQQCAEKQMSEPY